MGLGWRLGTSAVAVATTVLLAPGVAVARAGLTTAPEPLQPRVEIDIAGGEGRIVAGREASYTVTARTTGSDPVPAMIRVSVPLRMSKVHPQDGGQSGDGYVDWPVTLHPGSSTTVRLTGVYHYPTGDQLADQHRVAFTACVLDRNESQPVACATRISELDRPFPLGWLLGIAVAVAVAAAAATAVLCHRRRSRLRPADASGDPECSDQSADRRLDLCP